MRQTGLIAVSSLLWLVAWIASAKGSWLPWGAVLPWLGSFVPFILLARQRHEPVSDEIFDRRWERWEMSVVLALTAAAVLSRFLWLTTLPEIFGGDEGEMGMEARAILAGNLEHPFITGWLSHPTLWFFLQAGSIGILGDTIFGIRALSALCGVLTIPALYFFVRPWSRHLAMLATLLLVASPIHVHFSRLATNNIADPLLTLIALGLALDGIRRGRSLSFAAAGLTAGLAQHVYMGARLCLVLALALALWTLVTRRFKGSHWLFFFSGTILGIGPLLRHFLEYPDIFMARMNQVGIFQTGWFAEQLQEGGSPLQILGAQAWTSLGALFFKPMSGEYFDLQAPLFGPLTSVLVVLGVLYAARHWKTDCWFLSLAWLGCGLLFTSVLLVPPPLPRRLASLAPLFCILAAAGIAGLWTPFTRVSQRIDLTRTGALVTALFLALGGVFFYFRPWPHSLYGWPNTVLSDRLARHIERSSQPSYTYIFGAPRVYFDNGIFKFLKGPAQGEDVIEDWDPETPAPAGTKTLHFAFVPERLDELAAVRTIYPSGEMVEFRDRYSDDALVFCYHVER